MHPKYVVIERSPPALLIFPEWIRHNELRSIGKIISAGFVNMKTKCCYGDSISLDLKSHPETDNDLLKLLLGD